MKVFLTKLAAIVLFVLGIISLLSPIPGAFILLASSLALAICTSTYIQFCVQWVRSRISWINHFLFWLEEKTGERVKIIGETLPKTHPVESGTNSKLSHKEYVENMKLNQECNTGSKSK